MIGLGFLFYGVYIGCHPIFTLTVVTKHCITIYYYNYNIRVCIWIYIHL